MTTDNDDEQFIPKVSLVGRPRKQVVSTMPDRTKLEKAIDLVATEMEDEMVAYGRLIISSKAPEKEITDVKATLQEMAPKIYERDAA